MSESCISISATGPTDSIDGLTVGRISPNIYVKVVDKEGNPQDIGRTGEIMAKPEFEFMARVFQGQLSLFIKPFNSRDITTTPKLQEMQLTPRDTSQQATLDL